MNIANTVPVSNVIRRRHPLRAVPSVHGKRPTAAYASTIPVQTAAAEDDIALFWAMYEMHYDILFPETDPMCSDTEDLAAVS